MANFIEQLDAQIAHLLASWNIYTTIIAVLLAALILYPLLFWREPDTHPLLLARQSQPSPLRHVGESATYRSLQVPNGYPLKSGLNVKDAGAPRWTAGRDGDIRDIWRELLRPATDSSASPRPIIMTVRGNDAATEHDLDDITNAIVAIGKHLQQARVKRVAIYLPNSIEYLVVVFACAFYGLSPILLPYNQPQETVSGLLIESNADALVAAAASLPLEALGKSVTNLTHLVWIVEKSSRQMDWDSEPDGAASHLSVSIWHHLVDKPQGITGSTLPAADEIFVPGNLVTFWQSKPGGPAQVVEFTQKNIVSAVGALISAMPTQQRLAPSDLVLPADAFSSSYVLCLTLASLFQRSSLAISSVAGPGVDLNLASGSASPTVIIASSDTLASLRAANLSAISSGLGKIALFSQSQVMSAGRMPTNGLLSGLLAPSGSAVGGTTGKLRLIFTSERCGTDSPRLSTSALSDLRILTRARICYALTAPMVAGAVAQTNIYDYRKDERAEPHFGPPLSSVEIKLVDEDDGNFHGVNPVGEMVVSGPAVAGKQAKLGVRGTFREDCTLAYI